jgi:SWI/SNF-related matrix-associated actin-dependent regulator of chromatin subfamily A3
VVSLSVMSNWEQQIQEHCVPGIISFCVYYGTSRSLSPQELQKYDVVITTYQTVAGENVISGDGSKKKKKVENSLFQVQWKVSIHLVFVRPPLIIEAASHP